MKSVVPCLILFLASHSLMANGDRPAAGSAQAPPPAVLAIFQARCIKCHGQQKQKAGLSLATMDDIARGSDNGAVVRSHKPDESLLWQLVRDGKMPPKETLSAAERSLIKNWILEGAPGLPATIKASPRKHWAFVPPARPDLPHAEKPILVRTAIDTFIESALEQRGLHLGPEADRVTLLRRVSLDLTGLPPSLDEIDAFLSDRSAGAYERMVEHYLASPHYGERWGKYWLDAAGYADSNGYFSADSDRPLAYRYRDYVIRSLNADKPHDRFVQEQLAGDELAGYQPGGDVVGDMVELLTATHFLRNAPDGTGESDGNPDEVRTDRFTVLEGTLQITMSCLQGITIQCCRCHEHKFEPIAHDEYYRLQAIFYPVYCPERWVKPNDRVVAMGTHGQREEHDRLSKQVQQQITALRASLDAIGKPLREQLLEERLQHLGPAQRSAALQAVKTPDKRRSAAQQSLVKKYGATLEISSDSLAKRFPEFGTVRDAVAKAIAAREKELPAPRDMIAAYVETDSKPLIHHLLLRGQHNAPGPEVQPGVPAAWTTPGNRFRLEPPSPARTSSGRRSAFARWITSPENPLFARVMANRIWQHHFGVGLVATSENLGKSGARPSHPELLDYLATEFMRSGWSMKSLHRLILNSTVYRQSSERSAEADKSDPDNRLLGHFPLRRLDAEAVRDAMLAVSGELDLRLTGPYVPTHRSPEGNVEVDESRSDGRRRSVYLQQRRTQVETMLELFDTPSIVGNCTRRNTSTVPLQSLALLNSGFAVARASALAKRLESIGGKDDERRIALAFLLTCGRKPVPEECESARRFLGDQRSTYNGDKECEQKAWRDFCQMVLASNAFLYVE